MARKPRLDMAGFHHVVNRGVEKRKIFIEEEDFFYFLDLVCTGCREFDINLHSYCLMDNHYHLLIETKKYKSYIYSIKNLKKAIHSSAI